MTRRIVTFPHMGHYFVAAKAAVALFGDEMMPPPPLTRRTLEIGSKYSPEAVCVPFKYLLGNFIEVLEQGANVVVIGGGGCRFGFYGELQNTILKQLGYEYEFIKLVNSHDIVQVAWGIKKLRPHLSRWLIAKTLYLTYEKAKTIDHVETIVRENIGFESQPGSFERLFKIFLAELDRAATLREIVKLRKDYKARFLELPVAKPEHPLRVGIVGEIYLVIEPFSNFFVEKQLAQYGIEVHRFLSVSEHIAHNLSFNQKKHEQHEIAEAAPYLTNILGGHGTSSVAVAHRLAREGYDGLIHVKPFGCMPEVNAMPPLQKISRDYNFPILFFSFDSLTSETGIKTRLEAFYDMLVMKKVAYVPENAR